LQVLQEKIKKILNSFHKVFWLNSMGLKVQVKF